MDKTETTFKPSLLYFAEAEALEFVTEDAAHVYDEVATGFAIVRNMVTRQPVGFRLFIGQDELSKATTPPTQTPGK